MKQPDARRLDVARAIMYYGHAPFTWKHIITRCPSVKAGTVRACISALRHRGLDDVQAPTNQPGHWYHTADHVFSEADPVRFLVKAIEGHSVASRAAVGRHIAAVIPPELREVPKFRLVGFLDQRARAPHIKQVARFLREPVASAVAMVNALSKATLLEWDGLRVRRADGWTVQAALATMAEIGRHVEQFTLGRGLGHPTAAISGGSNNGDPEPLSAGARLHDLVTEVLAEHQAMVVENRLLREENQKLILQRTATLAALSG